MRMKRNIITIDEELCDGCGKCADACPEGAIQIIDGKARLVSDIYCDGLGACIGDCPRGAISVEEREAEEYEERKVMENVIDQGEATIRAHLAHLREHGETGYLEQALEVLREKGIEIQVDPLPLAPQRGGGKGRTVEPSSGSELTHWPVQLHLISPTSSPYMGSDLVVAADCAAFSSGTFHRDFLRGKSLVIACPKLDSGLERYVEKLVALVDQAEVRTITVVTMEVPCCGGLVRLVEEAMDRARRSIPVEKVVLSTGGSVLSREWLNLRDRA
jgi:ferredoxin